MAINGNDYDWESIEIRMPQGIAVSINEISYSDEKDVEEHYGKGGRPIGYGRKNYKATGSVELDLQEFEALRKAVGGSIYKASPCVIVVGYANDDQPTVTDHLVGVKFTKTDTGGKQGDDKVGVRKLDLKILGGIKWNGVDA